MDIGKELQKHRKNKGLTQEELGKILNVSRQTISKWETSRGFPDISNLIWLCDIYNVSLDELIGRKQISYEIKNIRKLNRRKDRFSMFPKHTLKVLLAFSIMIIFFMGYGIKSYQYNIKKDKEQGWLTVYSVVNTQIGSDGKYEYIELENGEKIDGTMKNIKEYKLENSQNRIKPNITERSAIQSLIEIDKLK